MYEDFNYKGWSYNSEDEVFRKKFGEWTARLPLKKIERKMLSYKSIELFFDVVDRNFKEHSKKMYYSPDIPYGEGCE